MHKRTGYTHAEYDCESEYWQDIEDAQNAQIEAQKSLDINDCILSSENENRDKSKSLIDGCYLNIIGENNNAKTHIVKKSQVHRTKKSLPKGATDDKQIQNLKQPKITGIVPQEEL